MSENLYKVTPKNGDPGISKDRLFSIIAHDLRNPVGSIKGLAGLLIEDFETLSSTEIKDCVKMIHTTSEAAHVLLENLLQWAASQDGRLRMSPDNVDVYRIVSDKLAVFREDARRKNIRFTSLIEKDTYIFADIRCVKIILRNLVSNAVKFTPCGGEVKILSKTADDEDFIEITVCDTGIGMSRENMDRLFIEAGYRISFGTERETGSGLGLMLCKDLVEKKRRPNMGRKRDRERKPAHIHSAPGKTVSERLRTFLSDLGGLC